jgi:hypothetical protein
VHEPWLYLGELSEGRMSVEPKLGFEYILWAKKGVKELRRHRPAR